MVACILCKQIRKKEWVCSEWVWMRWSMLDARICKFEKEQRMNACDIDWAAYRFLYALAPTFKQNTYQRLFMRIRTKRKLQNSFLTEAPIFTNTFLKHASVSLLTKCSFFWKLNKHRFGNSSKPPEGRMGILVYLLILEISTEKTWNWNSSSFFWLQFLLSRGTGKCGKWVCFELFCISVEIFFSF